MMTRTNVLWLIAVRLIIATTVLGIGTAVESVPRIVLGVSAVLLALAVIYFLSTLYILLAVLTGHFEMQLRLQIIGDLVVVTFLIFLSGEVASPYSSLYLLVIAYAALLGGEKDSYAAAASSTILYVGMIDLAHFNLIPFPPLHMSFQTLNFRIAAVVLGFVTVSYLSTTLSKRLAKVREELAEKSGSLEDLRVLNENIVESLRSGLITTDLDGHIRTANKASENLLEIRSGRLIGKSLSSVLDEEFDTWLTVQELESRRLEPLRKEIWLTTPDGNRKYIGLSVSPLSNQKDEIVGHITSFQDLTEIKRLQEEIAIKDKMAAIGHLAAAIAHEIRNPLASMHGSIQVLQRTRQLQGEDLKLMNIVLRESDRLNTIIEDFLSYARPRQADRKDLNLTEIIEETFSLLENHPSFKNKHTLELIADGKPLRMLGDADLMKQLCWNLATNSLKAMPAGGTLLIDSRKSDQEKIRISFRDGGVGMDKHEVNMIFQPFHSRFDEGLGIGMSIVYQIVHQHGGRVVVNSQKGIGTCVELEFARA